jgi:ABC-2 type transport system permease protein
MTLRLALRKLAAMFRRDLNITRSYRIAFLLEAVEALLGVASFYYLSKFVQSEQLAQALPHGHDYFSFALVGFAFFDYLTVSVVTFEISLGEARQNGTLEALLVSQTPVPLLLVGSAVYPFLMTALRTLIYLGWAVLVFHFPVATANWLGAGAVLLGSVLAFTGLGILSASYILLFKRGNPIRWAILGLSALVGGVMYPVSVLPEPLQLVARVIPISYSLEAMRSALMAGASFADVWPAVRALLLFAAVLLPLSLWVFAWSLRRTKTAGTLTHF